MGVISYRNRSKGKLDKNGRPRKPSWEYRFYGARVRGKRVCFSKAGFPTKAAAIAAGTKAQAEYMNTGAVFVESEMSYSDCMDSWMENYVAIRCLPTTIRNYENMLRLHIRPALGHYRLSAIRRETVQRFINDTYHRGYARNSLVNLLATISCSMRYAKKQGWIRENPAEDIDLPTVRECAGQNSREREPVSKEAIEAIFKRFPEGSMPHLALMLAYHCGLRRGEVFGLTWQDIDLKDGVLMVRHQMQWQKGIGRWQMVPPKYGSTRRVKLDRVMQELLNRTREQQLADRLHYGELYIRNFLTDEGYLNQSGEGEEVEFVILRENGEFISSSTMGHAVQVIKHELGYEKFDFHSLRHTHATELSEAGVNLKEIQRRLGHKTLEVTTRVYLHATDAMENQAVEIMNRMYEK